MKACVFFLVAVLALGACSKKSDEPFKVEEATVESVKAALRDGRVTCRAVTQQALERIVELNHKGPVLRAVLETNPDALALADALDRSFAQTGTMAPLHCAPLLVKDNFNTGDRMSTTAGSLTMNLFKAPSDAFVIAKLRAAGAIPVAKTHMDEWAQGANGYGSRAGQMFNAHKLNRNPGGSSGGSAIGTASGMGVLSTGSDTGGSIRIPAALNGVVGIKPTLGLVGRTGIIPSSSVFDVAGPITRTVADAAAMLGVMTGVDPGDHDTAASAGRSFTDYTQFLDVNGLSGARLGVLATAFGESLTGSNPDFDAAFAEALATLTARGATLRPGLVMPSVVPNDDLIAEIGVLAVGRIDAELSEYFATNRHPTLHSLADLVAASRVLGPDVVKILPTLEETLARPKLTDAQWNAAHGVRSQFVAAITKTMDDAQVEALVFPTLTCPATPLPGVRIDPGYVCKEATAMPYEFGKGFGGGEVLIASVSGFPEITVPAGFTKDGLPIALSFFGRPFSEATLIKLAYAYEQASRKRRPPAFLP